MKWVKKGNIFSPQEFNWLNSHAQVPAVLVMQDCLRIYYADRTKQNKSFPSFFDVDRKDPSRILYTHKKPIIKPGKSGAFDQDGIMPSCVVEHKGQVWLYYCGWRQGKSVPYSNFTGLAISKDGGKTFKKHSEIPVLAPTEDEPYLAVTPSILKEKNKWHMWYSSGTEWKKVKQRQESVYVVKYASSDNGIDWNRDKDTCIPQKKSYEVISNPSVIKIKNLYHMWFCFRDIRDYRGGNGSYRIGYAVSQDGLKWKRNDSRAGIKLSEKGWDSTMMCYPHIVRVGEKILMFYNGNDFGRTGIGYAILEE